MSTITRNDYTVPSVGGVQPIIRNLQYIGGGEWWAFLQYSDGMAAGATLPAVWSTTMGFLLPCFSAVSSDLFFSTCYDPATKLLGVYTDPSLNGIGGFYDVNALNIGAPPLIDAGYDAVDYNYNIYSYNGSIVYDGESLDFVNINAPSQILKYPASFIYLTPPIFTYAITKIYWLAYTSSRSLILQSALVNGGPNSVKTIKTYPSNVGNLFQSPFPLGIMVSLSSDGNTVFDVVFDGALIENIPYYGEQLLQANGNGYNVSSSGNVRSIFTGSTVLGTITPPSFAGDFPPYFIFGTWNQLAAFTLAGDSTFSTWLLPPVSFPYTLSDFTYVRNFAHNYSRGVPINYGGNLNLPPNTNKIIHFKG